MASSAVGVATLGSVSAAAEGDGGSDPPEVDPFHETFDDLSAFNGDVSAFEVVTSDGGN